MCGVVRGLRAIGWEDRVRVVAMETNGANCLAAALKAGKLITIPEITSIAKTLGSLTVARKAFEYATEPRRPEVTSIVVSDAQATNACVDFADDHRMLVEPSCGTALAAVYDPTVLGKVTEGKTDLTIVVIVCGGIGISLEDLEKWRSSR